ncbi:MAG: glycosyl hydrolase [Planctomycetaceae bacterium]
MTGFTPPLLNVPWCSMIRLSTLLAILLSFVLVDPVSAQTANSNASNDAKQVLNFLKDLKTRNNNRLLLGQDMGHGNSIVSGHASYVVDLAAQTGKWPGLIGGDYGLDNNHNVSQTNQVLIDHWNAGGLVTLSWHSDNPWTGGNSWDTNNYENLWDLVTPGNYAYNNWQNHLQEVGDALEQLRDAGVVVLWRPLHEMNGDWFWWGEKTWAGHEDAYKAVYQDMFNYLTNTRGLDNLLWVYSTAVTWDRLLKNYYPGSGYVDVVGIDVYNDNVDTWNSQRDYNDLKSLGKPMGLTEFGPDISNAAGWYDYRRLLWNIESKYPDFVFAHAWHDWWQNGNQVKVAFASNQYTWETFNDASVITRDEIQPVGDPLVGEVRIYNRWTGKYLSRGGTGNGSQTRLFGLNTSTNRQRWFVEAVSGQPGQYRLRCRAGGKYLHNTADVNNAKVATWTLNSGWWSQRWNIENVGGNVYRFRNSWTGRYLNVANSDQSRVETYDLDTTWWSQQWIIEPLN